MGGRLVPLAVVVYASEGAHGANDGIGGGSGDVLGAFENMAENRANAAIASSDQVALRELKQWRVASG